MRIGIDVRYLSHGLMGGVHAYVARFVPALLQLEGDREIVLYADTKRPLELRELPPHATVRQLPYRSPLSSAVNDLLMRRALAHDRLDVMHYPANYGFAPAGTRSVITLHDEINILPLGEILRGHRKNPRTVAMMTYLHLLTRAAVQRADLLMTVSEYSRQAIARRSGFDPGRILIAHSGPSPDMRRVEDPATLQAVRERYNLQRPFVLADALKNPAVLVRAWGRLPERVRQEHQIIFFSRRPDVLPVIGEAVARGEARLIVQMPTADLMALYSLASAFIFPSWFEGFGLPPIEAMICGAPVIASDRGSIPEITGGAALLAAAEDDAAFAQHIVAVLTRPEVAEQLRERGYLRARDFAWPRIARRILDGYQLACSWPRRGAPGRIRMDQA
jgi:glycosyltransferase involved in cell wall biosynthesis